MLSLWRRRNWPALGEGTIVVRGLVEADLPTDEIIMRYLEDAANINPAVTGWLHNAQAASEDTSLDLEDLIAALEFYEGRVGRALEQRGLHTQWIDGGYLIWRELP